MALIRLVDLIFDAFILLVIVRALLSWVSVDPRHPAIAWIYRLTDPILEPIRARMGALGPVDFSPMIVILLLIVVRSLVMELLMAVL